jgi:hypothetical protein
MVPAPIMPTTVSGGIGRLAANLGLGMLVSMLRVSGLVLVVLVVLVLESAVTE